MQSNERDSSAGQSSGMPYDRIGGDAGVRALVERFYDLMDADPAFAGIRALHAPALEAAREKLYLFLSGWLGGPPLYVARHGHPMLRARHLPFAIGIAERDQWLVCMRRALADTGASEDLIAALMPSFHRTADWMRNRDA